MSQKCGAIAPIATIGVVLPLNCSTTPIQKTTPILSAVVALNCLKVHMHEILWFVFHDFLASFNNRQGQGPEFRKFS
jgi:hypothetical protein